MQRCLIRIGLAMLLSACGSSAGTDGNAAGGGASSAGASGANTQAGGSAGTKATGGAGGSVSTAGAGSSRGGTSVAGAADQLRGAASLSILAPAGCALTAHYEDLPIVAGVHPVTSTEKAKSIAVGERDADGVAAKLTCQRIGLNAPYTIDGSITLGYGKNQRLLSFQAKMTAGTTTPGSVVVGLPNDVNYHGDCMFTPIEIDADARNIWGTFTCDTFTGSVAKDSCALGPSYFFFENCPAP